MEKRKVVAKYPSFETWHNGGMIKKPMLSPRKEVAVEKDDSGIDSAQKNRQKFQCEQCVYSTPYKFRLDNHIKISHSTNAKGSNMEKGLNDSGFPDSYFELDSIDQSEGGSNTAATVTNLPISLQVESSSSSNAKSVEKCSDF